MSRADVYGALLKFPDSQKALNKCLLLLLSSAAMSGLQERNKNAVIILLPFTMDNLSVFLNVVSQLRLEIQNYFLPVLLRLFMCVCLYFLSEMKFKQRTHFLWYDPQAD